MSAEELRRRSIERIGELRDRSVEYGLNVRFRPAVVGNNYVPAMTAEEIALQVLETNALARAYTEAIAVVNETYRKMVEPDDKRVQEVVKRETY